jgi:hypothetical protein
MADPADMIVPLLREMRAENAALHERTRELIKAPDRRLGAVEGAQHRYDALERKVRELESHK